MSAVAPAPAPARRRAGAAAVVVSAAAHRAGSARTRMYMVLLAVIATFCVSIAFSHSRLQERAEAEAADTLLLHNGASGDAATVATATASGPQPRGRLRGDHQRQLLEAPAPPPPPTSLVPDPTQKHLQKLQARQQERAQRQAAAHQAQIQAQLQAQLTWPQQHAQQQAQFQAQQQAQLQAQQQAQLQAQQQAHLQAQAMARLRVQQQQQHQQQQPPVPNQAPSPQPWWSLAGAAGLLGGTLTNSWQQQLLTPNLAYRASQFMTANRFVPAALPGDPLPDNEPVDAVYTWCNGSDPLFQNSLAAAIDEATRVKRHARADVASSPNRFREWGELRFSMRSLNMFAPWLRTIYVVVAGPSQVPSWLDTAHPRIRVVYHDALFPDPATQLPSFNSFAIESVLHRIPDLSRLFLYLNNDLLFARPALLRDFRTLTHFARLLDAPLTRAAECHQLLSMASTHTKTPSDHAFHDKVGMSCRSSPFFWDDVLARFYFSTPLTHWAPHVPRLWDREALELVEQGLGEHMTAARRNRLRNRDSDVNVHMLMESLLQSHSGQGPDSPTVLSGKLRAQDVFYSVFQDNGKTVGSRNGAFAAAALAMGRPLASRPRFFGLEDDLSPDVAQDTFDWTQQQMRETFTKFWGERAPWEKDEL